MRRPPMAGRGIWGLAAQKGLDNDHGAAAFGAREERPGLDRRLVPSFAARLIGCWLRIEQAPDLRDPVTSDAIREEARVSDAVEAGGQNVDQEPADELGRGQAHDLHAVTALDAVILPPEGHGAGIRADEAVVRDRDTVRVRLR